MAYTDLATLKTYLGTAKTTDDALLATCLNRAIAGFDAHFNSRFEAETLTRYYTAADIYRGQLWLDKPLLTVTSLTNGDADGTLITSADYVLEPRNTTPYWRIKLKSTADGWQFGTDGEIILVGTWGHTATAPNDVVQAVLRLSAYLYRQKDSQIFETTAIPELGVLTIPTGIPRDVMSIIETLQHRYELA